MLAAALVFRWVVIAAAIPTGMLLVEVLLSFLPRASNKITSGTRRPRTTVLVPAHDEALTIAGTLQCARTQLLEGDRMVVVADNCSDRTAQIAAEHSAEVFERLDDSRRGKGYALEFGLRCLSARPPEVVVMLDADCLLDESALERLVWRTWSAGRPAQAHYRMDAPSGADWRTRISAFAWIVKNYARPLGLSRVGCPCHLFGSGMAFTWSTLEGANIGSSQLVEDLRLGLDLARMGTPPVFCPEAVVRSTFPTSSEGLRSQRRRWEHGYLSVMLSEGPRVLATAVRRCDPRLLAMGLDLTIPPLALLAIAVGMLVLLGIGMACIVKRPLVVVAPGVELFAFSMAVGLAWIRFGRAAVSLGDLTRAPFYAISKIPIYFGVLTRRRQNWVRTRRH